MSQAYHVNIADTSKSHLSPTLLNNLSPETFPLSNPGSGQVLIRIHAAALNYRDLLVLADSPLYPTRTTPGLIPCSDGAGEIVSTGPNSKWSKNIGEAVIVHPAIGWVDGDVELFDMKKIFGSGHSNGTLTQHMVVDDAWVVKAPKNLSMEECAALPSAAGSAINVLESINLKKGMTVLTQGTGGVSCFTIQYAAALGCHVIATSSTDQKLAVAKELGATDLVNYRKTPDWADEVLRLTNGRGVDLVCEVGGSGTLGQSIKALRQGGTACLVGFLTPPEAVDVVMPLIGGGKILKGILCFSRIMLEHAVKLTEEHDLHPKIAQVFEWEDAAKAFEALRGQDFVGKIVIKV